MNARALELFDLDEVSLDSFAQCFILTEWYLGDAFIPHMIPDKLIRIEIR